MTITVTPTVEASNVPPRIRLNIAASAGETATTVTRLDPDGNTRSVRTSDGNPLVISGGTALVYDYEVPYGATVTYSSLESPATVSSGFTIPETRVWLIHPGVPALSLPIELRSASLAEETWDVAQGVFWPMGRELPVVQTDGSRRAPSSSVTVDIDSLSDLAALRTLLSDAGTLLLNIPTSLGYGLDTCYIAVGSVRNRRVTDIGADPYRAVELPFQIVDMPIGGSQSARTYADILAGYASYTAVKTKYASYTALLAGP